MTQEEAWQKVQEAVARGTLEGGLNELRKFLPGCASEDLVRGFCYAASHVSAWGRVMEVIDDEMTARKLNVDGVRAVVLASVQGLTDLARGPGN